MTGSTIFRVAGLLTRHRCLASTPPLALLLCLCLASASRAEFPKEVTIGDRAIECRTVEEIRKLGFECEEIPWQENAARVYIEAMNALVQGEGKLLDRIDRAAKALDFTGIEDEVAAHFKENEKAFGLAREASAMANCAFPMARAETTKARAAAFLPELTGAMGLSRELTWHAAFEWTRGEAREGVNDCFVAVRFGEQVAREPYLIMWLVGHAAQSRSVRTLEGMLASHGPDEAMLKTVAEGLAKARARHDDYDRALRTERLFILQSVAEIEKRGPDALKEELGRAPTDDERASWPRTFNAETTRKNVNAFFDFLDAQEKMPAWEALKPENRVEAFIRKHQADWDVVTRQCTDALTRAYIVRANGLALFEAVELRCAIERFRLAKKSYPKELAELAPDYMKELPVDPFSGKPWRYRLDPDGEFTLWSIGEDLKDDDGKKVDDWTPDIVFTSRKAQ